MMRVVEIISSGSGTRSKPVICYECNGIGTVLGNLYFGDLPGDEEQLNCDTCNGTGRTVSLQLTVRAVVPFNFKVK